MLSLPLPHPNSLHITERLASVPSANTRCGSITGQFLPLWLINLFLPSEMALCLSPQEFRVLWEEGKMEKSCTSDQGSSGRMDRTVEAQGGVPGAREGQWTRYLKAVEALLDGVEQGGCEN